MTTRSILAVFAHPDDEAFGTGGTLSQYAARDIPVYLVCATRGEVGEISDPSIATRETLGRVREDELRCAAETMGISELMFLNYRDSGMKGSEENNDERAFINAPAEEVIKQLVGIIRRLRPTVLLTFEPNGGYGHPDHIAIHNHSVAAYHASADPAQYPELGSVWQVARLFYTVIPRSFFDQLKEEIIELGEDPEDYDFLEESDLGWPDEKVNLVMDVNDTVDDKWAALECHRTQFGPGNLFRRIPVARAKKLMAKEHFALAEPKPGPNLRLSGLFDDFEVGK